METYIIKSVACLSILFVFYKLLLEKENMHQFKRFYLLFSLIAAIVIPFLTITTYIEPSADNYSAILMPSETSAETREEEINYLPFLIGGIYGLGVLFFSIKFIRNLRILILKIRRNPKVKHSSYTNVLLSERVQPHTFFSFIFFNRDKYLHNEIPEDVKIHEEAHAHQKHSVDVLFVELLQIIFWMNPFIFLLKKAIKLNHEFLADRAVIEQGIGTAGYQKTLLSFSSGSLQSELVNPINYSSIKKRFTVMKTKTSKTAIWARSLLVLPLMTILVYGFSTKKVLEKDMKDSTVGAEELQILELKMDSEGAIFQNDNKLDLEEVENLKGENFSGFSINASPDAPKTSLDRLVKIVSGFGISGTVGVCAPGEFQEKATPEMIAEYNRLVRHYNNIPAGERQVKQEDANRMMYIRSIMTPEQKEEAEKIKFDVPPPPPPAPPVMVERDSLPPPPPPVVEKTPPVPPAPTEEVLPAPPPPSVDITTQPTVPPPPPPVTFEELIAKRATFYYNGKTIEPEKARELVEVQKSVNVEISGKDDEKPVVKLTDKKEKK